MPTKVLSRPVQVFDLEGDRGHVQLPAGEPLPEWAEEQGLVTNPKAFEEIPDETTAEEAFEQNLGTGPFEKRRKEQLVAVAKQFGVPIDEDDTKAEIIKVLEREGIEPSTVPDADS